MKTSKFILLISIFGILGASQVQAACSWKSKVMSGTPGMYMGGCLASQEEFPDSSCSGKKPTNGVCCCEKEVSTQKKQALFVAPDIQITIPGLAKLSTDVQCTYDGQGNRTECEFTWIQEYLSALYNYAFSVVGIIATIILMVGGVIWITSAGDSGKIGKAKKMITGSIAGIALLFVSTLILAVINPALVNIPGLEIDFIPAEEKRELVATAKSGGKAEGYKGQSCILTEEEKKNGVKFYATGYYKPRWQDTPDFFCEISMNCWCPNGQDTSKTCEMYKNTYPNYHPCNYFSEDTPYCNTPALSEGDIAADLSCFKRGDKICVNGKKTYTVKDAGSGIRGRRIDIWSGDSLNQAYRNTGEVTVTIGPCGN